MLNVSIKKQVFFAVGLLLSTLMISTSQMMQYGARFFYWWFATTDPALSERAFKLYRTTQRSRKAFRMLKVLRLVHMKFSLVSFFLCSERGAS